MLFVVAAILDIPSCLTPADAMPVCRLAQPEHCSCCQRLKARSKFPDSRDDQTPAAAHAVRKRKGANAVEKLDITTSSVTSTFFLSRTNLCLFRP
ncbi:hypothetical protein EV361DRAFT_528677 [Lentinula raphanica]|nr:hypothetical protein EV361DRAFT_528677 [Lentinula raphanica]